MDHGVAVGLAALLLLGMGAQWLAWRTRQPAILLLLAFGIIAGPVLGIIRLDEDYDSIILPIISIAVGLILFEGGLSLSLGELKNLGGVVFRLVSVGALVNWIVVAFAARFVLGFDFALAALLAAVLVVTGPTVVGPLLRHVRPTGPSAPILKWEGIVIDPIGATFALLVFEAISHPGGGQTAGAVQGIALTIAAGVALGALGAGILYGLLRRYLVPDYLQNPATLAVVVGVFVASNLIQEESGLLATTVMGVILANQKSVIVKHIIEFKENLRVLLLSSLFIVLAARVELSGLAAVGWRGLGFVLTLVFIARPATVLVSTWRTDLSWPDRLFLMWMAPRGVVAASVASVFALELAHVGFEGAESIVPVTFIVIIGTVMIYGLTATIVARRLGLAGDGSAGVLLIGGHMWARTLAKVLQDTGQRVLIVDTNRRNVAKARLDGLEAWWGDALSETAIEELDLHGIGKMIAVTSNSEINTLAAQHFAEEFGRSEVYRLASSEEAAQEHVATQDTRGRLLFSSDLTFPILTSRVAFGAKIKKTRITKEFDLDAFHAHSGETAEILFVVREGKLLVDCFDAPVDPRPDDTLISLVEPTSELESEESS